jgi:hypothetical protein
VAWFGLGNREVLNGGEASGTPSEVLAAKLRQTARALQGGFWDAETGRMDYERAATSSQFRELEARARALRTFDLQTLASVAEKKAFWINLYNALTVHAILAFRPRRSVWSVPGFFNRAAYEVDGRRYSLNDIENGVLRANRPGAYGWWRPFGASDPRRKAALAEAEFDPRVHFALNCGSRSCPPIAFYDPDRIEEQLELAARAFVRAETRPADGRLVTSPIFKWYRRDFGPNLGEFLARYLEPEVAEAARGKAVRFGKYDWSLNG